MKERGVHLKADGGHLLVDAPAGALSGQDRLTLAEAKPALLRMLAPGVGEEPEGDDGRRFDARPSRHPGYTSLYDPIEGEWHDFPTKDCYPSIVELANKKRRKGACREARTAPPWAHRYTELQETERKETTMNEKARIEEATRRRQETEAVLLDWCPAGVLLGIAGGKTLLSWDRLVLCELQED
jgi:hypothetical protein